MEVGWRVDGWRAGGNVCGVLSVVLPDSACQRVD